MKKNVSNRNGRALEYKIVNYLGSPSSKFVVTLTSQARKDQSRDSQSYAELPNDLKESYGKCAQILHDWILTITPDREVEINRVTDTEAKYGNPIDIQMAGDKTQLGFSIKRNHSAAKHQRPSATVTQCGFPKGSPQDIAFREKYELILSQFASQAEKLLPECLLFNQLTERDANFINKFLYAPVCGLVAKTIRELCCSVDATQSLFRFLFGTTRYYKVIDTADEVRIRDYSSLPMPIWVKTRIVEPNRVSLRFSNGFGIEMRLHTASSRLKTKSLKFDSQPTCLPGLTEIVLEK